jgi:hypothetical protein
MTRRKGEITGHQNERDFPHIVELPLPSGGFRGHILSLTPSIASDGCRSVADEAATRRSNSMSGSASPMPRPQMRFATALAASA